MVLGFSFLPRRKPSATAVDAAEHEPVKLYEELLDDTANCTDGSSDPLFIEPASLVKEEKKSKRQSSSRTSSNRRTAKDIKFAPLEESYAQFDLESKNLVWDDENGERFESKPLKRSSRSSSKRLSSSSKSHSKRRSSQDKKVATSRRKSSRKNVLKELDPSLIDMRKFWGNADPDDARRRETRREAQRVYLRWAQYKSMREYQRQFQQRRRENQVELSSSQQRLRRHAEAASLSSALQLLEVQQRTSTAATADEEVSLGDFVECANQLSTKVAAALAAAAAPGRRHSADGTEKDNTTIVAATVNVTESPTVGKPKTMRRTSSRRSLTRKGSKRSVDQPEAAVDQPVKKAQSFDNLYVVAKTIKPSSATTTPSPTHKDLLNESVNALKMSRRHSTHIPRSMDETPSKESRRHSTHISQSADDTPSSELSAPSPGSKKQHLRKRRSSRSLTKSESASTLDKLVESDSSPVIAPLPPPRQDSRSSLKKRHSFRSTKDDSPNRRPSPRRQTSRSSLKKKTSSESCNEESPRVGPRRQSSRSTLRDSLKTKLASSSPCHNEGSPKALPCRQNSRTSTKTWTNGEQRPASKLLRRSHSSNTLKKRESVRSCSNEEVAASSPKQDKLQRRHSAWDLISNEDDNDDAEIQVQSSRVLKKRGSFRSMGEQLLHPSKKDGTTESDLKAPMLRRKSSRSLSRKDSKQSLSKEEDSSAPQRQSSVLAMKKIPSCGSLGYETEQDEEATPAAQFPPAAVEASCRQSSLISVEAKKKPPSSLRRRHSIHAPAITTSQIEAQSAEAAMASTRSLGDSQSQGSTLVRCKSTSELTGAKSKNDAAVPFSCGDGSGKNQRAEVVWAARILAEQERVEAQKRKSAQEWDDYILAEQKKAEERLAAEAAAKQKAAAEVDAHIMAEAKKAEQVKKRAVEEWEAHILAEQKKAEERLAMEAEAKKKAAEEWEAYILAEQKKAEERLTTEERNKKRTAKEWTAKLLAEENKALEFRAAEEEAKRKAKAFSSIRSGVVNAEEAPQNASVPAVSGELLPKVHAEGEFMVVTEERPGAITEPNKKKTAKEWTEKFLADKRKVLELRAAEEAQRKSKALPTIKLLGVDAAKTADKALQQVSVPAPSAEQKHEGNVEKEPMAIMADPSAAETNRDLLGVQQDEVLSEANTGEPEGEPISTPVGTHDVSPLADETSKETGFSEARIIEQTLTAWKTARRASRSKYLGLHHQVNNLSKRKLVLPESLGLPAEDKTQGTERSAHTCMSDATPRVSNTEEALRTPKLDNRQKESVGALPRNLVLLTEDTSHATTYSEDTPRRDNTSTCNFGANTMTPKPDNGKYPSKYLELHSQVNKLAGSKTTGLTKEKNNLLASTSKGGGEESKSKALKKDNSTSRARNSLGGKRSSTVGDVAPSVVHRSTSPRCSLSLKSGMQEELQDAKLLLVQSDEAPAGKDKLSELRNALAQAQHFYKSKLQGNRSRSLCSRSSILDEPTIVEDQDCVFLDPDDSSVSSSSSSSSSDSSSSSSSSEDSQEVASKKRNMRQSLIHAGQMSRDTLRNYGKQGELIKAARRKTQSVLASTGVSSVRRASHQPASK